jgi:hypothetical protein
MSQRKRLLLILGCLAMVLLAGYALLWLTAPREITDEMYYSLQKGMTEEQIEGILGSKGTITEEGSKGWVAPARGPHAWSQGYR